METAALKREKTVTAARDIRIDVARGIAIILVILGHCSDELTGHGLHHVVYLFHVPLFFFLSGMVLRAPESVRALPALVLKKIKRLFVPYVIFGTMFCTFTMRNFAYVIYGTRAMLLRAGSASSLWFLPVLFVAGVYCELALLALKKAPSLWLLPAAAVFVAAAAFAPETKWGVPFGADIAFAAAAFMLLGYLCNNRLPERFRNANPFAVTAAFAALFALCLLIPKDTHGVNMASGEYGHILLLVPVALCGIGLTLGVSALLAKVRPASAVLGYIGRQSMAVFLIQRPLYEHVKEFRVFYCLPDGLNVFCTVVTILIVSLAAAQLFAVLCPDVIGKKERTDCA